MSKTPYEIRLDVLAMAQAMLDAEVQHKTQEFMAVNAPHEGVWLSGTASQNYPKMYTQEELIDRASALYSFVSDSGTTAFRSSRSSKQ